MPWAPCLRRRDCARACFLHRGVARCSRACRCVAGFTAVGRLVAGANLTCVGVSRLQDCLLRSANHKVRIAAAQAMMMLNTRAAYGDLFASVFRSYVLALRNVEDVKQFSNLKYKDTLKAQVCTGAVLGLGRGHLTASCCRCQRRCCVRCSCARGLTTLRCKPSSSSTRSLCMTGCPTWRHAEEATTLGLCPRLTPPTSSLRSRT